MFLRCCYLFSFARSRAATMVLTKRLARRGSKETHALNYTTNDYTTFHSVELGQDPAYGDNVTTECCRLCMLNDTCMQNRKKSVHGRLHERR